MLRTMEKELKPNAFVGWTQAPSDQELSAALGGARAMWDRVLAALEERCGLRENDWNSYSPKFGWSVRVRKGKRNILYLVPCAGSFRVAFVIGGKAAAAAREEKAPARVLRMIEQGQRYPEGIGIRFDVKSERDVAPAVALALLKLAH